MAAVGLTWEEASNVCPSGVVPACYNAEASTAIYSSTRSTQYTQHGIIVEQALSFFTVLVAQQHSSIGGQLVCFIEVWGSPIFV